jgi:hypothetical protein
MSEISIQQLYAVALDVLSFVDRIENSIDEVLLEMRAINREMLETKQFCESARRMRAVSE